MTVSAISIYVSDLSAATAFYTRVLGYRVERALGDYANKLEHEGPSLLLCAGAAASPPSPYPSGVVLGHRTDDLEKRSAELRAAGVSFLHDAPQPFPRGRYLVFVDPFGCHHELLQYTS